MQLEHFCRTLNISTACRVQLEGCWKKVIDSWDGKLPFFLDIGYFKKHYPLLHAPRSFEEVLPFAEKVLEITEAHPELALAAHIMCCSSFKLDINITVNILPENVPFLGEKYSGMFALMTAVGVYPFVCGSYAELGLPEKYSADMMKWLGSSMRIYELGHPGIPGKSMLFWWLRFYVEKKLFRIGRLEYLLHPFKEWMPLIFRNRSGKLAVLCNENWLLQDEKYRINSAEDAVFTTAIREDRYSVTGTPVLPDGTADFEHPLTLDKRQWSPAVSPWDLCPSMHIPAGERMPFDEVKSSMLEAVEFFERYFHRHVPLLCCASWILNPAWEKLLTNSNMVTFRQECYAAPGPYWGRFAGMNCLFGVSDADPETLSCSNTAQKAFVEAYRTGSLGNGLIFVMSEDIPELGNQFYRKHHTPDRQNG